MEHTFNGRIDSESDDEPWIALAMGLKGELYKCALKRYLKLKAERLIRQSRTVK